MIISVKYTYISAYFKTEGGDFVIEIHLANKRLLIIAGHYGTGKTNVAVNIALQLRKSGYGVTIADLDIVNPYFRTADADALLRNSGVRTIIPQYANSNVDIPSVPPEIQTMFMPKENEIGIIDVGGDDGAVVLGMYRDRIETIGYEMLYVVNMFRPLIADPEEAALCMQDIEAASRLKCTAVVNNSNLGALTTEKDIAASYAYADEICKRTGLPLAFTSYIGDFSVKSPSLKMENVTRQIF